MKKIILILFSTFAFMTLALPGGTTHAWSLFPDRVCKGEAAKSPTCLEDQKQEAVNKNPVAKLLGQVANIIALIAGVVAVIMIIVSGFQFVTSGGSAEQVTKARNKIIGAIIGLVIIALAWTIIRLVIDTALK